MLADVFCDHYETIDTRVAYLNRGLREVIGGEWLWGGVVAIVPRASGLIWVLGVGPAT